MRVIEIKIPSMIDSRCPTCERFTFGDIVDVAGVEGRTIVVPKPHGWSGEVHPLVRCQVCACLYVRIAEHGDLPVLGSRPWTVQPRIERISEPEKLAALFVEWKIEAPL